MKPRPVYLSIAERTAYGRLEDVVGCKWSAAVLAAIGRGVTRPGRLERFIPGISTKVLNERLRKLLDYRLITKREFPGRILRVEYGLTSTGAKLTKIIEQIRDLDEAHAGGIGASDHRPFAPEKPNAGRNRTHALRGEGSSLDKKRNVAQESI